MTYTGSKNHYLGKSRQVLELSDVSKLHSLLAEQRAELMTLSIGYGKKRMTPVGKVRKKKDTRAIRNTRKNIARILTRLSQLRQQERMKK